MHKTQFSVKGNSLKWMIIAAIGFISNYGFSQTTKELTEVSNLLAGNYNTIEQSEMDSDYFNISLLIVPIWNDRKDGNWFYVEQAMATMLEKPYRQRVYQLTQANDSTFESAVFMLKDPLRFAGKTKEVEKLIPDSLMLKEGCSVFLTWAGNGSYGGGTIGNQCSSDLRGATYATSQVTLSKEGLASWDRGFNKDGQQVWGAEKGPYIFKRTK